MFTTILMNASDDLKSKGVTVMKYSGRAMYGKECIAISGDKAECMAALSGLVCQLIADAQESHGDEPLDNTKAFDKACDFVTIAFEFKQDSLGYDVVLYWPSQQIED